MTDDVENWGCFLFTSSEDCLSDMMQSRDPAYQLNFEYAYMQDPVVKGDTASCMVAHVLMGDQPVELARLVFHGVSRSIRLATMYTYDDQGQFNGYFHVEDSEDDGLPPASAQPFVYVVQGRYASPDGWEGVYQWEVHASGFTLEAG